MNNLRTKPMDIERATLYDRELRNEMKKIGIWDLQTPKPDDIAFFSSLPYQELTGNLPSILESLKKSECEEEQIAYEQFNRFHNWLKKHIRTDVDEMSYQLIYNQGIRFKVKPENFDLMSLDENKTEEQILKCEKIVENSYLMEELQELKLKKIFEPKADYPEVLDVLAREAIGKKCELLYPMENILRRKVDHLVKIYNEHCEVLKLEIRTRKVI